MSAPEVRWCEDSGMVLRRCNDGTWVVLDVVSDADDVAVTASVRLVPPGQLHREAEEIVGAMDGLDRAWARDGRRLGIIVAVCSAIAGAALGRWSR